MGNQGGFHGFGFVVAVFAVVAAGDDVAHFACAVEFGGGADAVGEVEVAAPVGEGGGCAQQ